MQIILNDYLFYGYIYQHSGLLRSERFLHLCAETIDDAHSIQITETYPADRSAKQ
jgi:hypothetical protein